MTAAAAGSSSQDPLPEIIPISIPIVPSPATPAPHSSLTASAGNGARPPATAVGPRGPGVPGAASAGNGAPRGLGGPKAPANTTCTACDAFYGDDLVESVPSFQLVLCSTNMCGLWIHRSCLKTCLKAASPQLADIMNLKEPFCLNCFNKYKADRERLANDFIPDQAINIVPCRMQR